MKKILLLLLLPCWLTAKEEINLIEGLSVHKNVLKVKANKAFKAAYLTEDFFVQYDQDIDLEKLDYSIATLPFICNVMSLVWISNKEYYIDSMDEEVFESFERLKQVFKIFYPKTSWNGRLIPRKLVKNKPVVRRTDIPIALLFSGGVDSTAASLAHRDKKQVLISAWGQCCLPLDKPTLWYTLKKQIIEFAKEYGHENAFIKSNYFYFLNYKKLRKLSPEIVTWRIDTIEDIGWAGLTAPILITRGIRTLHIGSSDCWEFPYPSACHPYIDSNITFAGIRIKHDQFDMTRFDKIAEVVNLSHRYLVKKPHFIVCQAAGNIMSCGACEKCCVTLMCILALNEPPYEYGYLITREQAIKNIRKLLKQKKLCSTSIWQFEDIKKKVTHLPEDLNWFTKINFNAWKAYDVKEDLSTDWQALHKLFPSIKNPLIKE